MSGWAKQRPAAWFGWLVWLTLGAAASPSSAETLMMPDRVMQRNVSEVVWGVTTHPSTTSSYSIDFGDGTVTSVAAVIDRSYIALNHTYLLSGTYTVRLTIHPNGGLDETATATIRVLDRPALTDVEQRDLDVSRAIQNGLRWLWVNQNNRALNFPASVTTSWAGPSAFTALVIFAFENHGFHLPNDDSAPTGLYEKYIVRRGLNFVVDRLQQQPLTDQSAGTPCVGAGIETAPCTGLIAIGAGPGYETPIAALPLAASSALNRHVSEISGVGSAGFVVGRTYGEVLQRLTNTLAWGQNDAGMGRGGWYYTFNHSSSDGSILGWDTLALLGAQAAGVVVPGFVISEFQNVILNQFNTDGTFDYWANGDPTTQGAFQSQMRAGVGAQALFLAGHMGLGDPLVAANRDAIDAAWISVPGSGGIPCPNGKLNKGCSYLMFNAFKGLKLQGITTLSNVGRPAGPGAIPANDWYADYVDWLLANQTSPTSTSGGNWSSLAFSPFWGAAPAGDVAIAELILSPVVLISPDPELFSTIGLSPATATSSIGLDHTVTATVESASHAPIAGATVGFTVMGQNAGASGTCSPVGCITGVDGRVSFTYHDADGPGTDTIQASVGILKSNIVQKTWLSPNGTISLSLTMEATEASRVVPYSTIPGTHVDYNLVVKNTGIAVEDVTVLEDVPTQLTFVSGLVVDGDACSLIGNRRVACFVGALAPGTDEKITLRFTLNAGTPIGPITATATVTRGRASSEDAKASATIGVIPQLYSDVAVPLDESGERIEPYLVVNGVPNGHLDKTKDTIVLTHGVQDYADFKDRESTLWTFLANQGAKALLPAAVNVVQFVWPGAFTVRGTAFESSGILPIPDWDEYRLARGYAFGAGVSLAELLRAELGPASEYQDKKVQLVGHSMGTVVNAYAASLLLPFIEHIDKLQFTSLDRPDHVAKLPRPLGKYLGYPADLFESIYGFHANFFVTALATGKAGNSHTEIVVDNYFAPGTNSLGEFYRRTGSGNVATGAAYIPAYNHTPLNEPSRVEAYVLRQGEGFNNDHSGVHQWYRWSMAPDSGVFKAYAYGLSPRGEVVGPNLVNGYCHEVTIGVPPFQLTTTEFLRPIETPNLPEIPKLPAPLLDQSLDPCHAGWSYSILSGDGPPTKAQDPARVDTSFGAQVKVAVTADLENFRNIHGCQASTDGFLLTCAEASSAYAQVPVDIPLRSQYLEIRYRFVNRGDGDRVTLSLDDVPVWSVSGLDHRAGEWVTVMSPIRGLAGRHMLTVALEGEGAVNAVFELGALSAIVGNSAPVVQAGPDRVVEATGPAGASVTLSPASISDPDGDPLITEWTGTFGTALGVSVSVVLPLGTHPITLRSSDPSGASNNDDVVISVRDTMPPSLSAVPTALTVEATSPTGAAVAWPSPLVVDAVDPSPALVCAPASGSAFPFGQTLVTCTAADASGNAVSSGFTVTVRDTTPPTVNVTSPTERAYLLNQAVASSYSCTDSGSGVQSCSGPVPNGANIDTASVGLKSFTVGASDFAGQSTSVTKSYSVSYASEGVCLGAPGHQILQPINADGTSVFKTGSTVPVKFRVCDATGASIGTQGVVMAFRLVQTLAGTTTSTVNEPVDSTTPDTAFRWSATDRQWIFNISTQTLSANVTYMYLVTLNDGSTIQFQFGTK